MAKQAEKNYSNKAYEQLVKEVTPKSEKLLSLLRAFFVGGLICILGQGLNDFARFILDFKETYAASFQSAVLIFLTAALTTIGVFDKIGKFAGAGTFVPITGFANSIAASAVEFHQEGLILGVGAKMFTIAGPVLVYGTVASALCGILYQIIGCFF